MSEEKESQVQEISSQEESKLSQEEEIFNSMYARHITATTEHVFTQLPKVFIDGYSYVKIALDNNYINCSQYVSRSSMTFQGCMQYKNGELKDARGIYRVTTNPILSINSTRKMTRSLNGIDWLVKQIMLGQLLQDSEITQNLEIDPNKQEILISYDNYNVSIFNKFIKGKILKFPLEAQQGHLYVSWIPKLPKALHFEKVTDIYIYNHTVNFNKEVIKFDINVFGGNAQLIYNQNYESVQTKLFSPDHEEMTVSLASKELYLFSHRRPRTETAD